MPRNYGVKRHPFQPLTVRMRLGDAFAVFDSWPGRLMVAGIVIAGILLMASCAEARPRHHHIDANGNDAVYLPHPSDCPSRAFCGCGASVEVFGRSIRSLWPAAAWFRFPRTSPAPGMAAVRSHHVMILKNHIGGSVWLTADYNSGGHQSRLHARSISGYTIVNPHGGKVAMQ